MTNMDEGVLNFLIGTLSIESMVDVGCGPGGMVKLARSLGLDAYGIDGDPEVFPDFLHNFEDGSLSVDRTDLAWSVEFLEHIEEQYLDNVFSVFKQSQFVFCTANPKPGPWHFNCNPFGYWVDQFYRRGFAFNAQMTEELRFVSTMDREFVEDTGMFFFNIGRCL